LGEGWRETVHADDLGPMSSTFEHARALRIAWQFEYRQRDAAGNYRWMLAAGTPWHAPDGVLLGYVGSVVDITERRSMEDALRSSEERMRFMMMELDHRVKNTLASVLSVCDQTFAASGDMDGFREAFHGRLQAMARTHEALALSKWAGVRVREMVHLTVSLVAPGGRDNPRLSVDGPDILLPASAATPIAATLHELATNALKHGAWSSGMTAGAVRLDWELIPGPSGPVLAMRWRESSPKTITVPASEGFGVSMIRGMIGYELRGEVDLRFPTTGVECDLSVPLGRPEGGVVTHTGHRTAAAGHR
jgi:two-component sensor histidine kinase